VSRSSVELASRPEEGDSPESQFFGQFIRSTEQQSVNAKLGLRSSSQGPRGSSRADGISSRLTIFHRRSGSESLGMPYMGRPTGSRAARRSAAIWPTSRRAFTPPVQGGPFSEHLLGDAATWRAERLFLARSWRMHPDVCGFISELSYDGRLEPAPDRQRQRTSRSGLKRTGLAIIPSFTAATRSGFARRGGHYSGEVTRLLG